MRQPLRVLCALTVGLCLMGCARQQVRLTVQRAPTSVASGAPVSPRTPEDVAASTRGMGSVASNAVVVRGVDGDTVRVRWSGVEETVRLIGIDTPETHRPGTPIECFGPEASRYTAALLPPGTEIRLEGDVERRDRFGRLLAYVVRAEDGLFVNLALARNGFAHAYTYPPNVAHADAFVEAAGLARDEGRGLWSGCSG